MELHHRWTRQVALLAALTVLSATAAAPTIARAGPFVVSKTEYFQGATAWAPVSATLIDHGGGPWAVAETQVWAACDARHLCSDPIDLPPGHVISEVVALYSYDQVNWAVCAESGGWVANAAASDSAEANVRLEGRCPRGAFLIAASAGYAWIDGEGWVGGHWVFSPVVAW